MRFAKGSVRRWWLLGGSCAVLLGAPNCASTDTRGDETHFVCKAQEDCDARAPGTVCRQGYCRQPEEAGSTGGGGGGGGAPATGGQGPSTGGAGGGCDDGSKSFCANGMGGGAGAAYYYSCNDWERANLKDVECPADAGAAVPVLVSWCEHFKAQITESTHMYAGLTNCVGQMLQSPWTDLQLDLAKVCEAGLPEKIRTCSDSMTPCERPPLCIPGGTFTCDDIREACPAITAQQCRSGFDSAVHEGRVAIHECLTIAPASEDCAATFYRCVWGL